MTEETSRFPWIRTINERIARDSLHILREVVHEFELKKAGQIRISGYPHDAPDLVGLGQRRQLVTARTEVADMLVARGVFRSAKAEYVGGSPYISEADAGDWLFVEADEQTVRDCLKELEDRFKPKPAALPSPRPQTAPAPVQSAGEKREEPPGVFRQRFFGTLAIGLAWLVIVLIVMIVAFLSVWLIPGAGDFIIRIVEAVAKAK